MTEAAAEYQVNHATHSQDAIQSSLNICLIGATGAGKTCFLGGLYLLTDIQQTNNLRVNSPHKTTTQLLKLTADQLKQGIWPPPTAASNELTLEVYYNKTAFKIEVLDYPGEDFLEALGDLSQHPNAKKMIHQFHKADVVLFLIDSLWLQHYGSESHVSKSGAMDALASAISHCRGKSVAFVLTKWDAVVATDPQMTTQLFIAQYLRGIKQAIQNNDVVANFFSVSATGDNPNQPYPQGYEALFAWIFTREKRKKRWQRYKIPVIIASIVALLGIGYMSNDFYMKNQANQKAQTILTDQGLTLKQQLTHLLALNWQSEAISYQLAQRVNRWLEERRAQLLAADSIDTVQRLTAEVEALTTLASPWQSRFETLHTEAQQRLHDLRMAQVRHALQQRRVDYLEVFQQFERDYPASNALNVLRAQFQHVRHTLAAEALDTIRNIPLTSQDSFRTVSEQLTRFIAQYPDYEHLAVIENVLSAARLLAQKKEFVLSIAWSIAGNEAVEQKVVVLIGGKEAVVLEGGDQTVRRTWEANRRIVWQVGEPVQVRLLRKNWFGLSDEILGSQRETGGLAILLLADVVTLTPASNEIQGDLTVKMALEEISSQAASDMRQHLSPSPLQ